MTIPPMIKRDLKEDLHQRGFSYHDINQAISSYQNYGYHKVHDRNDYFDWLVAIAYELGMNEAIIIHQDD